MRGGEGGGGGEGLIDWGGGGGRGVFEDGVVRAKGYSHNSAFYFFLGLGLGLRLHLYQGRLFSPPLSPSFRQNNIDSASALGVCLSVSGPFFSLFYIWCVCGFSLG